MKVLVIGDSHTDIYKAVRFVCATVNVVVLRIPGISAQGLIKMDESTLHGGSTVVKFVLANMDADLIIFFVGSVDLDFVYYAKAAQKLSKSTLLSSSTSLPSSSPSLPSFPPSISPSSSDIPSASSVLAETPQEENSINDNKTTDNNTNKINININNSSDNNSTINNQHKITNISTSDTGYKIEEEATYAADRFFQFLDKHIIPIVPATTKLVINSLHPPTLDDARNEGRLKNPELMGNLYHSLNGLEFPPLPSHKERTDACLKYNDILQQGAQERDIKFINVCTPMINPKTGVLYSYLVRGAPHDVHIVDEMAIPTYITELQKIDSRWIVDNWKKNRIQKISKTIQTLNM